MKEDKLVSLVIPVYNEENQIGITIDTIHKLLKENSINHEFVFIDDGSRDGTWRVLEMYANNIREVNAIKLSRNFGKESALCAGLEAARGDACLVMDADLQHPPEHIPEMVRLWSEEGYEVIEGKKTSRGKESFVNKVGAKLFYKLLNKATGLDLDGASDYKLMDKKVIDAWKAMPERNTFFRGMSLWVGYKRKEIPIVIADREVGTTKWNLFRLIKLAVNAITAFTALPLQIVTGTGFIFFIGAIVLGIQTLIQYFSGSAIGGFTTVILLQLIIGSTLMISLGIIGTYLARVFDEVKERPRYLIGRLAGFNETENTNSENSQDEKDK